jgi:hypothetical protein
MATVTEPRTGAAFPAALGGAVLLATGVRTRKLPLVGEVVPYAFGLYADAAAAKAALAAAGAADAPAAAAGARVTRACACACAGAARALVLPRWSHVA